MVFNEACRQLARDILLAVNKQNITGARFCKTVSVTSFHQFFHASARFRRRGCRGGEHLRSDSLAGQSTTSPVFSTIPAAKVPTVYGSRQRDDVSNQLQFNSRRHRRSADCPSTQHNSSEQFQRQQRVIANVSRTATDKTVMYQPSPRARRSLQRPVGGEQVYNHVSLDRRQQVSPQWHDDASSPQLIRCVHPGFVTKKQPVNIS